MSGEDLEVNASYSPSSYSSNQRDSKTVILTSRSLLAVFVDPMSIASLEDGGRLLCLSVSAMKSLAMQ